jgi:hypothetical protein
MKTATRLEEISEFRITRKTESAYRITCPSEYPVEHEVGPCVVTALTDKTIGVSFGAGAKGYDMLHRYERAVEQIVTKKFSAAIRPLVLPPASVPGDPHVTFKLLHDAPVFHETPDNVRDTSVLAVGSVVRLIVQFVGVRRTGGVWEHDSAVTQVFVPPKPAPPEPEAPEAPEPEAPEAPEAEAPPEPNAVDGADADHDGDVESDRAEKAVDTNDLNEMLTTEVEQDVESFVFA